MNLKPFMRQARYAASQLRPPLMTNQSTDTREHFSWEEPVHNYIDLLLVILVGVSGIELAIPGSAVLYHSAKSLRPWPISPHMYSQILVLLRHLHTNANPKFFTAIDRCFRVRHRSSNSVFAHNTLTTAPPKFVKRLITVRAKLAKPRR